MRSLLLSCLWLLWDFRDVEGVLIMTMFVYSGCILFLQWAGCVVQKAFGLCSWRQQAALEWFWSCWEVRGAYTNGNITVLESSEWLESIEINSKWEELKSRLSGVKNGILGKGTKLSCSWCAGLTMSARRPLRHCLTPQQSRRRRQDEKAYGAR